MSERKVDGQEARQLEEALRGHGAISNSSEQQQDQLTTTKAK